MWESPLLSGPSHQLTLLTTLRTSYICCGDWKWLKVSLTLMFFWWYLRFAFLRYKQRMNNIFWPFVSIESSAWNLCCSFRCTYIFTYIVLIWISCTHIFIHTGWRKCNGMRWYSIKVWVLEKNVLNKSWFYKIRF